MGEETPSLETEGETALASGPVVQVAVLLIPESTLGLGLQHINLGGIQTFSPHLQIQIHASPFSTAIVNLNYHCFTFVTGNIQSIRVQTARYTNIATGYALLSMSLYHMVECIILQTGLCNTSIYQ